MTAIFGCKVLIVEDEHFVAAGLARYFTELGAEVLGPVSTTRSARRFLLDAQSAILDIHVGDGPVFCLADELSDRRVPFVFYSGCDEPALPERFRHIGCLSKPIEHRAMFDALIVAEPQADATAGTLAHMLGLLPRLRLAACLYLQDASAADRLVKLTLEHALAHIRSKPRAVQLDIWLGHRMKDVFERQGTSLMN